MGKGSTVTYTVPEGVNGVYDIYLTVSIPVVIGQKIYRKVKYGCSMFD